LLQDGLRNSYPLGVSNFNYGDTHTTSAILTYIL
jgi:hypothetical protein